jgi:PAS domain S-box-containing protein
MNTTQIKILHLEDIRSDADIVKRGMKNSQLSFEWLWVSTRHDFENALTVFYPDIILCDHSLPGFTSVDALNMLKKSGLDVPFILITATISEEFAVMMMRQGIADYLLKDRIQRLPTAVASALEKWQSKREKETHLSEIISNERKFRSLIENSNDLILLLDANLNIVYISPNCKQITGWTPQQMMYSGLSAYVNELDRPAMNETLQRTVQMPGKYLSINFRFYHQAGSVIHLDGSIVNLFEDDPIRGVVINIRDVTERKKTEASLQRSEANLNAIIENSDVNIYSLDLNFRYITFNTIFKNAMKCLYGLDIQVGQEVSGFLGKIDPAEANDWRARYNATLSGESLQFVKELNVGGMQSFTSFSLNPIIQNQEITGLSCFGRDVTAEKLAEEKVRQSEAHFRALIENNYDAIILRDEDLNLLYRSPSANTMLGNDEHDQSTTSFYDTIHLDDIELMKLSLSQAHEQPGEAVNCIGRIKHKRGHYIWVDVVIRDMIANESVKGIIFNYHDISERMEADIQREKMTLDITQRNKNLEQFTYIVSHNLRAPVANILGISNLLEIPDLEEDYKQQALLGITSSARRLDEVIADLNTILQEQQKITEYKQEVEFQDLVDDVRCGVEEMISVHGIMIKTNFEAITHILTIKSYLYSVFYNLITNSIKYRQRDAPLQIEIISFRDGDRTGLLFRDNGIGINLKEQGDKVFGLYKRFHPGTEGKGMGLFMVRTQVESLGGTIGIKSEVNEGTEFTILF